MKIIVEPHNPAWATEFARSKASLEEILSGIPIKSIEHVGSTSVPGLYAKSVLDIDIVVTHETLPAVRAAMSKAGYLDQGEMGIPGRFQFRQPGYGEKDAAFGTPAGEEMRRNTYAMIEGGEALRSHLDLRRVLREDAELREEYGKVKLELAKHEYERTTEYSKGKKEILRKILKKAGWGEEELLEEFGPIEPVDPSPGN